MPAVEGSSTFKRLQERPRDLESQPDLERWYNDAARPLLERPALRLEGLSGGGGLGSPGGASGGGRETPRERIERLVREGRIIQEAVDKAERVWHERLRDGVRMPNREPVQITLDDLYHAIVDPRILRHPERIESAITHIYEIRASYGGRREAYSKWSEGEAVQLAVVILEAENRLWSLHLIDEDRLRRYTRKGREVLWTQSEQQ